MERGGDVWQGRWGGGVAVLDDSGGCGLWPSERACAHTHRLIVAGWKRIGLAAAEDRLLRSVRAKRTGHLSQRRNEAYTASPPWPHAREQPPPPPPRC